MSNPILHFIISKRPFTNMTLEESERLFDTVKTNADSGCQDAQYILGYCYLRGIGTIRSPKLAVHYFRMAAQKGNTDALVELANLYKKGYGVERSLEKAFSLYESAAKKGNYCANVHVGRCYEEGIGVPRCFELAMASYIKAARKGHASANYFIGQLLKQMEPDSPRCASDLYLQEDNAYLKQRLLEKGNADPISLVILADNYKKGTGVEKNIDAAVLLYYAAAESGNAYALRNLGDCFERGAGVEKSYDCALDCYVRSLEAGYDCSAFDVANLLHRQERYLEASNYWLLVTALNCEWEERADAEYILGAYCTLGLGLPRSNDRALWHYRRSARQGNVASLLVLATVHVSGELNCEPSLELAQHYLEQAFRNAKSKSWQDETLDIRELLNQDKKIPGRIKTRVQSWLQRLLPSSVHQSALSGRVTKTLPKPHLVHKIQTLSHGEGVIFR